MIVHELKAVYTLWLREIKRFLRQKSRIFGSVMQPLLFLFFVGKGISSSFASEADFDYMQFMYPGIICMSLLFTSFFSGISIVIDRQFGFLKEVMVAPISRVSIAVGKALGGCSVALIQGTFMLFLAPLMGIQLSLLLLVKMILTMFLISFTLTSLGLLIAVPMESTEGFQMIMTVLVMPMFFLSGAFYPLENLPVWLSIPMRINPLTYGVDALRNVFAAETGLNMMTHQVYQIDVLILGILAAVFIFLAVFLFQRKEYQ